MRCVRFPYAVSLWSSRKQFHVYHLHFVDVEKSHGCNVQRDCRVAPSWLSFRRATHRPSSFVHRLVLVTLLSAVFRGGTAKTVRNLWRINSSVPRVLLWRAYCSPRQVQNELCVSARRACACLPFDPSAALVPSGRLRRPQPRAFPALFNKGWFTRVSMHRPLLSWLKSRPRGARRDSMAADKVWLLYVHIRLPPASPFPVAFSKRIIYDVGTE